jgi:hypothetical protein
LSKCGPILRLPIVCTRYADADVTCSCDEVHVGRSIMGITVQDCA